jgi:F-type H+-transporting ATPase subunit delta
MQGSSRGAFAAGRDAFVAALASGADVSALAGDLFAVTGALDSSASLRRALVDPSRDASAKRGLVESLFGPRTGAAANGIATVLVSQRWADDRDLGDATESLAVEAVVACAEEGGRLDALEDDLFRFGRVVAADSGLRDALSAHGGDEHVKAALVEALLEGKASPEAVRLARQGAMAPRGRRFSAVLESYLAVACFDRKSIALNFGDRIAVRRREMRANCDHAQFNIGMRSQFAKNPVEVAVVSARRGDNGYASLGLLDIGRPLSNHGSSVGESRTDRWFRGIQSQVSV